MDKREWELIVLALTELASNQDKVSAELFHEINNLAHKIMTEHNVAWPYAE